MNFLSFFGKVLYLGGVGGGVRYIITCVVFF